MIGRGAATLAALALAATLALWARYESTREAWRVRGGAIDTSTYDAAASDAAYREVEDALAWVARAARASAVVLVAAGAVLGRVRPRTTRKVPPGPRRAAARALDVAGVVVALALAHVRLASPGLTELLDWTAPAALAAILLGLALNGATLGERLFAE